MKASELLDLDLLAHHVAERNVNTQRHPSEPLTIHNYSQACQFRQAWDDVTRQCRGLILHDDGTVMARPFPKFHNLGEHGEGSHAGELELIAPLTVFDKLDGSLGVSYRREDGQIAWATRGSFVSEQAVWANNWWRDHGEPLDLNLTYLTEIIYPENRIVLDYDGMATLVLLAIIDIESGEHLAPLANHWEIGWPGEVVRCYGSVDAIDLIDANDRPDTEGYVVLSGDRRTRVKVKADEYVRLHRILTGVSNRTIWDLLRTGQSLEELLDHVPDEFHDWLRNTVDELTSVYDSALKEAKEGHAATLAALGLTEVPPERRKDYAELAKKHPTPGLLFALLDGKPIADRIWKMVRPERAVPFTSTGDDAEGEAS